MPIMKNVWSVIKELVGNDVLAISGAGAPTNGTTGKNFCGVGSVYIDRTNGRMHINNGTKASPNWVLFGPVSGNFGLGTVGNAKATYDFAVDGGAVGAIIPTSSPTIPSGAIILGGTIDITTTLTSGGAATIALGTTAGSSATSLKAATAVATWAAGQLALVPVFTAATYVKLTTAGRPNLTVAVAALTAGKFDVNLVYIQGN